jgi:glycosyl transferase family 25
VRRLLEVLFLDVLDDNQLTRPEIGCSASHNKIYETIIKDNYSHAIIFEDDSQISNNFSKAFQKIKKVKSTILKCLAEYEDILWTKNKISKAYHYSLIKDGNDV